MRERLHLLVEDDGVGIPEAEMATLLEHGIGVSNVNERLKVLFGTDYRMWIDSKPGQGTRIEIEVPELADPPGGGILTVSKKELRLNKLEESPTIWSVNGLPDTLAVRTRRAYDRMSRCLRADFRRCCIRVRISMRSNSCGIEDGMRILEVATGSGEMFRRIVRATATGHVGGRSFSQHGGIDAAQGAAALSATPRALPSRGRAAHAVPRRQL